MATFGALHFYCMAPISPLQPDVEPQKASQMSVMSARKTLLEAIVTKVVVVRLALLGSCVQSSVLKDVGNR